jgi:hypothetical protein
MAASRGSSEKMEIIKTYLSVGATYRPLERSRLSGEECLKGYFSIASLYPGRSKKVALPG